MYCEEIMKILVKVKGGPGSGNFDHAGIPGSVGGSAPSLVTFPDKESADAYGMETLGGNYIDSLPASDKLIITYFTIGGYRSVNKTLKTGKEWPPMPNPFKSLYPGFMDIDNASVISTFDKIMDSNEAKVDRSFTALRGFGEGFFDDKKVGDIFTMQGYTSTSLNPAHQWYGGTAKVTIRPGAKGLYIKPASTAEGEYEYLLNRGTRFRIMQKDENGIHIETFVEE